MTAPTVTQQPVAWMYTKGRRTCHYYDERTEVLAHPVNGYTETPLFTREQTVAEVVAWLRSQAEIAQTKSEAAILAGNDRGARDYFAGKIAANHAADALVSGEWSAT